LKDGQILDHTNTPASGGKLRTGPRKPH